jgi:hypothetical protein
MINETIGWIGKYSFGKLSFLCKILLLEKVSGNYIRLKIKYNMLCM